MTITTAADKRPLVERHYQGKPKPPKVPHTVHLREFLMPDGRRLLLDRRSIAFLCEAKPEEFGGKEVTIVAFKTAAKPCPVTEPTTSSVPGGTATRPPATERRPDHERN